MGVFKWLRRERVTVTTHNVSPNSSATDNQYTHSTTQIGTIRTEEYKRDLAEFQARRSFGSEEKKKCGRHSLPVSCTDCTADPDNTFNYEKKSAIKYKKKTQKRARSTTPDRTVYVKHPGVPDIHFLYQNQIFMPGNMSPPNSFSEPQKHRRHSRHRLCKSPGEEFHIRSKQMDFKEDDLFKSPPDFCRNNSLPFNVANCVESAKKEDDIVDGPKAEGDLKMSSQNSSSSFKTVSDDKLCEVMSELKNLDQWADEQLHDLSPNGKSDDCKSDTSAYGLPIASASNLDVTVDRNKTWNQGKWGIVPVQVKKLTGVTIQHVRKKQNTEINILRQCRHPNIILLMGLYPDIHGHVHIICELCIDSINGILHVQGRILSAQTSVQYILDIANALVFLRMQGYLHTELSSHHIMITGHDTAKLSDMGSCAKLKKREERPMKEYEIYSPEPQYVNIDDNRVTSESTAPECEPLISAHPSETYISSQAVAKAYTSYKSSKQYRWHAPELFTPSNDDLVYPCPKSDVYSLCLILWECCNATMPWKHMTYDKLKEQYTMWKTSVPLAKDGTYPGCLLSLLQSGLTIQRQERINLEVLQNTLQSVKRSLDDLGYIIIPARLPPRQTFSTNAWDTTTDSDCLSPQNIRHEAVIHNIRDSSTESEKDCSKSDSSPRYETIQKLSNITYAINEKCRITDGNIHKHPTITYDHLPEKEFSSACSTPIAKIRARIKDMETPGSLHRSDSTEYCSILSPNRTVNFAIDDSKDSIEKPSAKLSRSFTPKSYKPLHIKVPEFNFDSIKPLLKDNNNAEKSSYNFDIKNYSLPTTPIARSNKLRKNAWLSGDMGVENNNNKDMFMLPEKEELQNTTRPMLVPPTTPTDTSTESAHNMANDGAAQDTTNNNSPESVDTIRDHITGLRRINPPHDFMSPESDEATRDHTNSCSLKSHQDRNKDKIEDVLANVNVKPLVAIHERWIYEANRKTCRSLSLPDHNRSQISAVKPASHCVDTLQKSLPQLNTKKVSNKIYRTRPASPNYGKHGPQWEQFCQARDAVAKNMNFTRDPERNVWKKYNDKGLLTENPKPELKTDQSTDTSSIEEFIKDLIRKEFQHLMNEISEETSTTSNAKNEEILSKGVANIIEMLNSNEDKCKKETKSFSRVKINGNNKPLLQITFSRSGENSLQVLDNCVNVTICDNKEKNQSLEDTLIDDIQVNSLKRCQAFNALQEARSTEDLYIDDDLSTMQENFGDRVKLIPLHGSLHEILCEKEDECCLIKVKQENGCDTIYFRCDNSDTESRDAIDGQDTVVFKRSISLVEERIQRIIPKDKRTNLNFARKAQIVKNVRPKSEIFEPKLNIESRARSNSTPTLSTTDKTDEIEVNIENVVSYQDSSSDECLKCQVENDDFELIEQKIEEEYAKSNMSSLTSGYLEKISEENLSVFNEEIEKD